MGTSANTKTFKVLSVIVTFAIVILAFMALSLANPGTAKAWLNYGPDYQYPSIGGTWKYGFWTVKVRSYYRVNKCHGSTVKLNRKTSRSAATARGYWSRAQIGAVNSPYADDRYYYWRC